MILLTSRRMLRYTSSFADTTTALAGKPKINNILYRIFHWTPEFKLGKESSMAAVWVNLHNLALQY